MPTSTLRRGMRTTTTVNPDSIVPDINIILKRATPWRSQLSNLLELVSETGAPKTKKVRIGNYMSFDPLDECSLVTVGTGSEERFAVISVAQSNVANNSNAMFYQPGDELYLIENDQTVEVVATPYLKHTRYAQLSNTLLGTTNTGLTPAGQIAVRVIKAVPFRNVPLKQLQLLGRAVAEGQDYNTAPFQRDATYDMNLVERIDTSWQATDEETKYIRTYGIPNDFKFQQEEAIQDIKTQRELRLMFGQREIDTVDPKSPLYRMGGVLDFVRTNVMSYNPSSTTNFEKVVRNWMTEHAFKYTPNGMEKYVLCGLKALGRLSEQFDQIRRVDMRSNPKLKAAGLDIQTYDWLGQTIHIIPYQHFRIGTKHEDWMLALDVPNIELKTAMNYTVKNTTLPNQRLESFYCEWAGTVLVHQEYTHALLRT